MAPRKRFLLRLHPDLYAVLEKWAADELRSVNGQMEFLLKEMVRQAGRQNSATGRSTGPDIEPGKGG